MGGLSYCKRELGGFVLEVSSGKSSPNPPKNIPEAFLEYPEIANKTVSHEAQEGYAR